MRGKRVLTTLGGGLLAGVLLLAMSVAPGQSVRAQDDATVWIDPPESFVYPDEEFDVTVRVTDATDLGGFDIHLDFDDTMLDIVDVVEGGFLSGTGRDVTFLWDENPPGTLTIGAISTGDEPGADGDGALAVITFRVTDRGTSDLHLYDVTLFDTATPVPGEETPDLEDGWVGSRLVIEVSPSCCPDRRVNIGDVFTETVMIYGAVDLGGFDVHLDFDPTVVAVLDVAEGDFLGSTGRDTTFLSEENPPGTLTIGAVSTGDEPGANGEGVLATITLEALAAGDTLLDLYNLTVFDTGAGEDTPLDNDGLIHVVGAKVWIDPPSQLAYGCNNFEVTVMIQNASDLGGFDIHLDFDDTLVEVVDVVEGGFLSGTGRDVTFLWDENPPGTLTIGAISTGDEPGADGEGALAIITMHALKGEGIEGISPLDLYNVTLFDTATPIPGEEIPTLEDGEVEVQQCQPVGITDLWATSPVRAGTPAEFIATVEGSPPITYTWDFGDGSAPVVGGATATYTYTAAGTYTATLTAENECGVDTETVVVEVTEECWPVEILDLTSDSPVELSDPMHFTATLDGTYPMIFDWDFGDEGAGSGTDLDTPHPAWIYAQQGLYTVSLTITNCVGFPDGPFTDTWTMPAPVEVTCTDVDIVSVESDEPVELGNPMHFTATVTGTYPTYEWDFGGAGTATGEDGPTPTFTYDEPGTYTVVLTVTNDCPSTDVYTLEVEVFCNPVQITDLTSDSPVDLGAPMHFTATINADATEPVTYNWDFGGAGTATGEDGPTPTFTYDEPGTYTVTLTVENPCGEATETQVVEVEVPCEPVAIVSLDSNSPVEWGEVMYFTATVSGDEPITYNWDFGGAGTATGEDGPTPTFLYDEPGTYTVTLTVENPCGEATDTLVVEMGPFKIFLPYVAKDFAP